MDNVKFTIEDVHKMYKQIIIARKDLNMSAGKLAAQVSHASMAFLTNEIRNEWSMNQTYFKGVEYKTYYSVELTFEQDLFEQWIDGEFTKCVLKAKNKSQLLKAKTLAEEMGMTENEDFFCIYDNCHTELTPEDNGRTLTCIGFKPMDSEIIDKIGKKYQLYS